MNLQPDGVYVDCTVGTGGHFREMAQSLSPQGFLLGLDTDPHTIEYLQSNLEISVPHQLINANFSELSRVCYRAGQLQVDGILFDLGLSSFALDDPERGFSYLKDGPLDMRFNPAQGMTAGEYLNSAPAGELTKVFRQYGEEHQAAKIARAIVKKRQIKPIETTEELAQIIRSIVPAATVIKSLSRIFQAIRIHVNRELAVLETALIQALLLLRLGGRLVVISYHSLEDRLVKQFFNKEATDCICPRDFPVCRCGHKASLRILTPKPIKPTPAEITQNPRARSAKLRAAEKI